jgi:hypothetical protein
LLFGHYTDIFSTISKDIEEVSIPHYDFDWSLNTQPAVLFEDNLVLDDVLCVELSEITKSLQTIVLNAWPQTNCVDRNYATSFPKYFNATAGDNFDLITDIKNLPLVSIGLSNS